MFGTYFLQKKIVKSKVDIIVACHYIPFEIFNHTFIKAETQKSLFLKRKQNFKVFKLARTKITAYILLCTPNIAKNFPKILFPSQTFDR